MRKHTLEPMEVDIPDDLEFDRIGLAKDGEPWVSMANDTRGVGHTNFFVVVLRKTWKPPAFFKKGWIAMDSGGDWYWHLDKPTMRGSEWNSNFNFLRLEHVNWTPPKCTDWKESLREIV